MPPTETTSATGLLQAHRQAALRALDSTVGADTVCSLSRSGSPSSAAKVHEGAAAALGELARIAAARPEVPLVEHARDVIARWQGAARARGDLGHAWSAYHAGADEALRDLIEELEGLPERSAAPQAPPTSRTITRGAS